MKNQWSQFPFVLRRKILLTFLAGIASIAVSLVIFTVAADRILLVLGGFIFAASLVLGSSLWRTAARGQYEVVEGICAGVSTPMLRRYRKIQLIDEQGAERTLLLSKTAKFQIGARYRFYFQKGSRPAVGNDAARHPLGQRVRRHVLLGLRDFRLGAVRTPQGRRRRLHADALRAGRGLPATQRKAGDRLSLS